MGDAGSATRAALLAPWWALPALMAAWLAVIRALRLSALERSPLFASLLVVLPWLPLPLPAAALLWTGPGAAAVWTFVGVGVVSARVGRLRFGAMSNPRRAPLIAAAFALALYGFSAVWLKPILPDGDEPHYLILAQSLIEDGDLRIENNHRQGDYLAYSLTAANPDYLRRGVNGQIYSIHAPGLAVLIAPAMWLAGYPGVVAFLGLVAALSTGLVWLIAYRVTDSAAAAWFGWASCALTAPFFFQATEVFPDGIAATCLLLGTVPLMDAKGLEVRGAGGSGGGHPSRSPWVWMVSGAALAMLPWLQTRLAVLAIAATACLALRMRRMRDLLAFAVVPGLSALSWFLFFAIVYGTLNPTAPYGGYTQTSLGNLVRGIPGLLVDQQFGILPNAPVYGFVFAGLLVSAAARRRWAWEPLAMIAPYMMAVGSYQMWWGGTSVPARLLAPVTLIAGVGAARVWHQVASLASRTLGLLALVMSVAIAATMLVADHGRLLLNFRDGISLWLEWASDLVDLPRGLPSLFRDSRAELWTKSAIWAGFAFLLWLAVRFLDERPDDTPAVLRRPALSWRATVLAGLAVMGALLTGWSVAGVDAVTPQTAAIDLLRRASTVTPRAYDFGRSTFLETSALLSAIRIGPDRQRRPARSPTLFAARDLPAGVYELRVSSASAAGALVARVGSTSLPFLTLDLNARATASERDRLRLDRAVRTLAIDGDERARSAISALQIAPVMEDAPVHSSGGTALRAARYGSARVYFFDDHAYAEPTGFWVAGGRTADVELADPNGPRALHVRNAPVRNHVRIEAAGRVQDIPLAAGEERVISLPDFDGQRLLAVRIASRSGFRPSAAEPGNTDQRFLGVWIEPR